MSNPTIKDKKPIRLRGKTIVYVDWANVYGWSKSLKKEISLEKLFAYFRIYDGVEDIRLYFGEDVNPKSKKFLVDARNIGYTVVSKEVKYIASGKIEGQVIHRRKCDFDMEVSIDVHKALAGGVEGFVFLTGDGDFAPLYEMLIALRKQVVVIYTKGHIGREVWAISKGIFKAQLKNIVDL